MKNKRIVPLILASIIISSNLIGCEKSNDTTNNETPYYTLNIDGEKQFFDEDYEEVTSINSFLTQYLNLSVTTDYIAGGYLEQFYLYTDDVVAMDAESGFYESFEETAQARQIIRTLHGFEVTEIDFYEIYGDQYATVYLSYTSSMSHASDEYLESNSLELDTQYNTNASYKLLKQDNGWRLEEILTLETER